MKLGVLSDTHDYFDPQIPKLFQGVEHILHGGDIGLPHILHELQQIAPVTGVSGNTDDPGFHYPAIQIVELAGHKFLIHHIVNPHDLEAGLKARISCEKAGVVVFGHTHKPFAKTIDGAFYFNPGYAGKTRFGMPRTLAILHCNGAKVRPEFLPL